jgi:hypothetical protein
MSTHTRPFSFAGSMPGISHAGIRLDIEGTRNTGSHVADDGVSRITPYPNTNTTEPTHPEVFASGSRHFFSWTAGRRGERTSPVFSPLPDSPDLGNKESFYE